jgi:glycine oxidase
MNKTVEAAIIGGGVIGGSIAYHLAKKGRRVVVLERERIVSGASGAAAGMLGAQSEMHEAGPLFDLARQSRAMFPRIAEELKELTGIDIGLVRKGLLKIALNPGQAEECRRMIAFQREAGEQAQWLSAREAREIEPGLSPEMEGAALIPDDGQVSAPDTAEAFLKAAAVLGAEVREYSEVKALRIERGRVTGVVTEAETIACDQVVVTTGVWGMQLLAQAGFALNVFPVKGECFSVVTPAPLLSSTIFAPGCYLVPKRGGRLVVGATMIERSYDRTVSVGGIMGLMAQAQALLPGIVSARWETSWAGLRPQTPDGLPYLGEFAECEGLFVAGGHYRNGILLSPVTGTLLSGLMDGSPSAAAACRAFRPDRHTAAAPKEGGG